MLKNSLFLLFSYCLSCVLIYLLCDFKKTKKLFFKYINSIKGLIDSISYRNYGLIDSKLNSVNKDSYYFLLNLIRYILPSLIPIIFFVFIKEQYPGYFYFFFLSSPYLILIKK